MLTLFSPIALRVARADFGAAPAWGRTKGFALVVVLLLLVALSMVGIASLRGNAMQEKMAGNLYFRTLSFTEAESVLRSTVARIDSKIGLNVSTPAVADSSDADWKPWIAEGATQAYWSTPTAWSGTASRNNLATSANGYSLKAMTEFVGQGNQLASCEGKLMQPNPCLVVFTRMTTNATDAATGAAVILQQYWSFPSK